MIVSGFGPKAISLAAAVGDGFASVAPEAEHVQRFRAEGGGDKVCQAGTKVCWGPDEDEAVETVHRLWPNEGLPGELAQVLPTPAHFEQASALVTKEMIGESVPCGPDVDNIVEALQAYADAGFDELYVRRSDRARTSGSRCSSATSCHASPHERDPDRRAGPAAARHVREHAPHVGGARRRSAPT